ncbi:MAG: thioredoxin family protein [Rhodocyclaceae bacterium]|nr:thioredoxin family protein [Rhodocyclaceae bacterium]MBX3671239.1 thioredoxin family protein [Rhodocyclaceae bacterium]
MLSSRRRAVAPRPRGRGEGYGEIRPSDSRPLLNSPNTDNTSLPRASHYSLKCRRWSHAPSRRRIYPPTPTSRCLLTHFEYEQTDLTPAEVEALPGPTLLNFGANWCGICRSSQAMIQAALAELPQVRHLRIADRPGARLGRSYRIKLWPTLVFLLNGQEISRLVRPQHPAAIDDALAGIASASPALHGVAPPHSGRP